MGICRRTKIAAIIGSLVMSLSPLTASADQTVALAKPATPIVPTAGFGTTVRERMRDRAITRVLPALQLSDGQRNEIQAIQQGFRAKRPGTRGASEPELASYHAQLLRILTPSQREQLRIKMKQHWIKEHSP